MPFKALWTFHVFETKFTNVDYWQRRHFLSQQNYDKKVRQLNAPNIWPNYKIYRKQSQHGIEHQNRPNQITHQRTVD